MQQDPISKAEQAQQLVSALADGELRGAEFGLALAALQSDPEARARWHGYHLVGDVLRQGTGAAVRGPDEAFVARLRERMARETPRVAPAAPVLRPASLSVTSANDAVWRWKLVAGLCSLAAVGVLTWQLAAPALNTAAPQLAQVVPAPVVVQAVGEAPVMIRDPRLDQLIAAHQQQGGTSALQMPAGFLRNATFERPAR